MQRRMVEQGRERVPPRVGPRVRPRVALRFLPGVLARVLLRVLLLAALVVPPLAVTGPAEAAARPPLYCNAEGTTARVPGGPATARRLARLCSLVVVNGPDGGLTPRVPDDLDPATVGALRAAGTKVVVYVNGTATNRGDLPEEAYAHDAAGQRLEVPNGGVPRWAMNMRSPAATGQVTALCTAAKAAGYDGCYLDRMGAYGLRQMFADPPVDPVTGQPTTLAEHWADCVRVLDRLAADAPGVTVVANWGWVGREFPPEWADVALRYGLVQNEGFGQPEQEELSEDRFWWGVHFLGNPGALGIVKRQPTWSAEVYARRVRVALGQWASGTRAGSGRVTSWDGWQGDPTRGPIFDYAGQLRRLGRPTGVAVQRPDGLVVRPFSRGVALTLPAGHPPATFRLARPGRGYDGKVVSRVVVAPGDGEVVLWS